MIGVLLGAALAAPAQRYVVAVGSNVGAGTDEPLRFADRDAERVAHVLADLGDVPGEHVVTLRSADADAVRSALRSLSAQILLRAPDAEVLLFFYYSGHADAASMHLGGTELPFDELVAELKAMPVDVRVLVVDACQSGELTRRKGAEPAEPFAIVTDDQLESEGLAVIASSSVGEDAQESDRLQGGVFTHHFVTGLMGAADRSSDGRITLTEAHTYARDATIRATSAARFVQHPSFATELRGGSDLVLTRVDEPGASSALELAASGRWLVFDVPSGGLVAEAEVAAPARLVLPRGAYLLRLRRDDGIRETTVVVDAGESLEVGVAGMTAVSPGTTVRKGIDEDLRAAWAVLVGGGLVGPPAPATSAGVGGQIGAAVDLEVLTLAVRVPLAVHRSANSQLVLRQQRVGVEVSGARKSDVGAAALGLGVRAGLDVTHQGFETPGLAPARLGLTARVGPLVAVDLRLGTRQSVALVAAADIQLSRRYDPLVEGLSLGSFVVPTLSVELARYVR